MATQAPYRDPVANESTVEKADYQDPADTSSHNDTVVEGDKFEEKPRGVLRMEILSSRINLKYKLFLYGGFTLLAYVMSLDQYTAGTYLTTATSVSFSAHSTLSTIRTLKSVFQAVSQPPMAKIADVYGRVEAYCLSVFLYALGYVIVASSNSIYVFAVGNSIYILGITSLFLLQNIIIADMSSLRNRVFWSIFPSLPGAVNVWVSGSVTQGILATSSWRWGFGMFCILTPVLSIPIITTLAIGMRKPHESPLAPKIDHVARPKQTSKEKLLNVFWKLDILGLILLVGGSGMMLVTITLANSRTARWTDPHSIALLVVGGVCVVAFVFWERYGARNPLIPFHLLTQRTVVCCFLIALFYPMAGGIIGGYFYTFLVVAANQSVRSATRITSIGGFTSTLAAGCAGLLARYTRRLKVIMIGGFCTQLLGIGLMIRYRGSTNSQFELAIVQVVRGLGAGCVGFPTQAILQASVKHEHMAVITAGYLLVYYLSGGIGSSIGGGIWTNQVPNKINAYMGNDTLAATAYANPIGFIATWAPGTAPRLAVARAHDEVQRTIIIVGLCVSACGLVAAAFTKNVKLTDEQSLEDAEEDVVHRIPKRFQEKV